MIISEELSICQHQLFIMSFLLDLQKLIRLALKASYICIWYELNFPNRNVEIMLVSYRLHLSCKVYGGTIPMRILLII